MTEYNIEGVGHSRTPAEHRVMFDGHRTIMFRCADPRAPRPPSRELREVCLVHLPECREGAQVKPHIG